MCFAGVVAQRNTIDGLAGMDGPGAGVLSPATPAPAPAPAPTPMCKRHVFISLSALLRDVDSGALRLDHPELDRGLFFFGSKRFWIFPESDEQRAESYEQGDKYMKMAPAVRDLILAKEARNEVCWLKPDILGEPDVVVFGEYERASTWFESIGYAALKLDPVWWRSAASTVPSSIAEDVIANFSVGMHDYGPVIELLQRSDARLVPVLKWPRG